MQDRCHDPGHGLPFFSFPSLSTRLAMDFRLVLGLVIACKSSVGYQVPPHGLSLASRYPVITSDLSDYLSPITDTISVTRAFDRTSASVPLLVTDSLLTHDLGSRLDPRSTYAYLLSHASMSTSP